MMQDATFGQGPTFNSDVGFAFDLSPDRKAFTASFSGLAAVVDGNGSAPIATRVFSFSLPISCAEPGQEVPFFVSGFVASEKEATAHLVFTVNDQTTVTDFPADSNTDFIHQHKYLAGNATDVRITVFLLANRDSKSDSGVHVIVNAIDTDMAKHEA